MKIIQTSLEAAEIKKGCILTIGNFDGVHIGHQAILAAAKKAALHRSADLIVMTFEPHPLVVLNPTIAPQRITPLPLKKHLLQQLGVDWLYIVKSSREILSLTPAEFVHEFLIETLQPDIVVEGHDFNFGSARSGSIETLKQLGAREGFAVVEVEPREIKYPGGRIDRISSSLIRKFLIDGRVDDAAVALGRFYRLIGKIVPGKGKGKKLGFPTANLNPLEQIIPTEGVYAGFVHIAESIDGLCNNTDPLHGVFSIGTTQTYGHKNPLLVEAHLLEKNVPELAGKYMAMDFVKFLRTQIKFNNEKQLSAQIENDCRDAKRLLQKSEEDSQQ